MPMATKGYFAHKMDTEGKNWLQKVRIVGLFGLMKAMNMSSPILVKYLNKRGIFVSYWVLNTIPDFELAYKQGVNGIITDTPTLLKAFLDSKNKEKH